MKNNYVIMRGSEKETDLYGKIIRVDTFAEDYKSREWLKESIAKWEDKNCLPELVEDPKIIEIFDCLSARDILNDNQIEEYKSDIRDAIETLERLL